MAATHFKSFSFELSTSNQSKLSLRSFPPTSIPSLSLLRLSSSLSFSHDHPPPFLPRTLAGVSKRKKSDAATAVEDPHSKREILERSETVAQTSTTPIEGKSHSSPTTPPVGVENGLADDGNGDDQDFELEHGYTMSRVCDRLIEVFMLEKTKKDEWKQLLAYSQDWSKIRPYFFKRCMSRANKETDAKRKRALLKLSKNLKAVDDDMERHNELLTYVKEHSPELDAVVARRRTDFNNEFFHHLELLCKAVDRSNQQDDLARVAAKCLAAVEAHNRAAEDDDSINIAQKKFDDILNSPSLDAACKKIQGLAKRKQLDSTLMLLITKACAAANDSNTMTEEVKETMRYIYMIARGSLQKLIPKEIRIIQHILHVEDPNQRLEAITEAFSPGNEQDHKSMDMLYTTPEKLLKWIKIVLDAYYLNKQSTLMESARHLMTPTIISQLEVIKVVIEEQFM